MPPKSKVSARAQKELAAQRARAQALQYLQVTGSGPSQRELEADRQRRQQLANPMSAAATRRVAVPSTPQTAAGLDPRVRDNTLQALAHHRAAEMSAQQAMVTRFGGGAGPQRELATLPDGWQEAVDLASGDKYYWNERTKETSWEHPGCAKLDQAQPAGDDSNSSQEKESDLPKNWEAVKDPQSGDMYYWNSTTGETTWTRPVDNSVPLRQALEAKSKLDSILSSVGTGMTRQTAAVAKSAVPVKSDHFPASSTPLQEKNDDASTTSYTEAKVASSSIQARPFAHTTGGTKRDAHSAKLERPTNGSRGVVAPDAKRQRARPSEVDPMDPTGTGGKWSDGLDP